MVVTMRALADQCDALAPLRHQHDLFAPPVTFRERGWDAPPQPRVSRAIVDANLHDPARNFPTRAARRLAFDTWLKAGCPWPPPAGLASACASAAMRNMEDRGWR